MWRRGVWRFRRNPQLSAAVERPIELASPAPAVGLDPRAVGEILDAPSASKPIGYFCLAYRAAVKDVPMLETAGGERRRPRDAFLIRR